LAARWAHNPKVVGSSPTPATNIKRESFSTLFFCAKHSDKLYKK
jgi:hypothetical protein